MVMPTRITGLAVLTPADLTSDDLVPVVDVTDTSMAATGTTKGVAAGDFAAGLQVLVGVHNVMAYGAAGDGVADDAAAMQAALDAAGSAGGGTVLLPEGTYRVDSALTLYADVTVELAPGAVIDARNVADSVVLFTAAGTETLAKNLSANAAKGALSVSVTAGDEAAFAAGDYVKVGSTARWTPNVTLQASMDQRIGEILVVASTASGSITFRTPLVDGYLTADTAFIAKLSLVENVALVGPGTILGKGTGSAVVAVQLDRVRRARVDGVAFHDFDMKSIEFKDALDSVVENITVLGGESVESTFYGVVFNHACQDCRVAKSFFRDVRHGVTTGGSTSRSGINRRITVEACHAQDTKAASFDSHAGCENYTVIGCTAIDPFDFGVSLRCPAATVIGCTVIRPGSYGIYARNQSDRTTRYIIQGNRVDDATDVAIYYRNPSESELAGTTAGEAIDYVNIEGNTIARCLQTSILVSSAASYSLHDVLVANNIIRSCQPASSRVIRTIKCARVSILGNILTDVGATTDGMRIETTTHSLIQGNLIEWGTIPSAENGVHMVDSDDCLIVGNLVVRATTGINLDASCTNDLVMTNDCRTCTTPVALGVGTGHIGRNNPGYNPVGVVTPAVPATTVAVAAVGYDRTFYVTAGATAVTMTIQNGPAVVVPAAALGAVRVPAGKTVTPTYTNAPTWVVEGE